MFEGLTDQALQHQSAFSSGAASGGAFTGKAVHGESFVAPCVTARGDCREELAYLPDATRAHVCRRVPAGEA
jgi:hypothetical protein